MKSKNCGDARRSLFVVVILLLLLILGGAVVRGWNEPALAELDPCQYSVEWNALALPRLPNGSLIEQTAADEFTVVAPVSAAQATEWVQTGLLASAWEPSDGDEAQTPGEGDYVRGENGVHVTVLPGHSTRQSRIRLAIRRSAPGKPADQFAVSFSNTSAVLAE